MIKIAEIEIKNIDIVDGKEVETITKKPIKYSDSGKLLVDEKGTKYITAWEYENVTETDEDIDSETLNKVMRELGACQ